MTSAATDESTASALGVCGPNLLAAVKTGEGCRLGLANSHQLAHLGYVGLAYLLELGEPFGRLESHFMLQLRLSSWLVGVLVLAVGILLPLGLAASRNKLLQQAWEKATGKTV